MCIPVKIHKILESNDLDDSSRVFIFNNCGAIITEAMSVDPIAMAWLENDMKENPQDYMQVKMGFRPKDNE